MVGDEQKPSREKWTGTKTEFCRSIRKEYAAHPGDYKDPKDASRVLYKKHIFSFKWSMTKCYELLKKTPIEKISK